MFYTKIAAFGRKWPPQVLISSPDPTCNMSRTKQIVRQKRRQEESTKAEKRKIRKPTHTRKVREILRTQKQVKPFFSKNGFKRMIISNWNEQILEDGAVVKYPWRSSKDAFSNLMGLMHEDMINFFRFMGMLTILKKNKTFTTKTFKNSEFLLDHIKNGLDVRTM